MNPEKNFEQALESMHEVWWASTESVHFFEGTFLELG